MHHGRNERTPSEELLICIIQIQRVLVVMPMHLPHDARRQWSKTLEKTWCHSGTVFTMTKTSSNHEALSSFNSTMGSSTVPSPVPMLRPLLTCIMRRTWLGKISKTYTFRTTRNEGAVNCKYLLQYRHNIDIVHTSVQQNEDQNKLPLSAFVIDSLITDADTVATWM